MYFQYRKIFLYTSCYKFFLVSNVDVKVRVSAWPCVKLCNTVTIDIDILMFFYQIKY